ncbi:hypothetical protein [Hyalangium rubrum]|uniref:Uncharacterized protein n=1 Tax=Hyalangium rubrum TaxID=3103134 RepID=A0ABU5HG09_9BACT|nr:hypothetical protein [Hyalangium sp. s54d21]MDY7231747.1 hypothetical protein [Hyalangium sp. s54d21]
MTTLNNESNSSINITLTEVETRVLQLVEQGNADAYQIGWLYNYVVDRELTKNTHFKDAKEFFQQKVKVLSQSALTTYGAVARAFSAAACVKYGVYHLYTLLTYEKLANLVADGNEPGPTAILVPQEDGTVAQKAFADCTMEELKAAVKHKRTPPTPLPENATARVELYRNSLEHHFGKENRVRVRARVDRDQLLISLQDIPEAQMSKVVEALMDSLNPSSEAA